MIAMINRADVVIRERTSLRLCPRVPMLRSVTTNCVVSQLTAVLVFIGLVGLAGNLSGCSRKQKTPYGTLRLVLDLTDRKKPKVAIPQGTEFNVRAGNAGLKWMFAERQIDGKTYVNAILYKGPRASNLIALASNDEFALMIGDDEFIMVTKIDVQVSVKPEDGAQISVDAVTEKPLSECNVFPPGAYSFRIIREDRAEANRNSR